jgi:hypothetical protein
LAQQFVDKFSGLVLPKDQTFCVHGANYQHTLAQYVKNSTVVKVIEWLNTSSSEPVSDGYFEAELMPGEHLHAPIAVVTSATQSIAWDFIVEDDERIDFMVDIVLPNPPLLTNLNSAGADAPLSLFGGGGGGSGGSGGSGSSGSSGSGGSSHTVGGGGGSSLNARSATPDRGEGGDAHDGSVPSSSPVSLQNTASESNRPAPFSGSIVRTPTNTENELADVFRPQTSQRIDMFTRLQVSRGNSYVNWPCTTNGLLVIQFERPSQSWLGSLTCGISGSKPRPVRFKYKVCAFQHKI